jgi:hypothetical protein
MFFLGALCLFVILPLMLRRYTERTVVIIAVTANEPHIAMYAFILWLSRDAWDGMGWDGMVHQIMSRWIYIMVSCHIVICRRHVMT